MEIARHENHLERMLIASRSMGKDVQIHCQRPRLLLLQEDARVELASDLQAMVSRRLASSAQYRAMQQ